MAHLMIIAALELNSSITDKQIDTLIADLECYARAATKDNKGLFFGCVKEDNNGGKNTYPSL